MTAVVAIERSAVVALATKTYARESAEMRAGDALGQGMFQSFDNRVDHRRKWLGIISHRRRWMGAQDFAFGQNQFQRPKGAFVGRLLVGD
jgi:hypothetical protein